MSIAISLTPDAESCLRAKAAAVGESVDSFASRVLERLAKGSISLRDLSGPLGDDFRHSGMTENELTDLLEREKHAMRAERHTGRTIE